jgi:hypothetical protein
VASVIKDENKDKKLKIEGKGEVERFVYAHVYQLTEARNGVIIG